MQPEPTRTTPLFRFDPGWPYVIAGLGLLVAAVLIPAQRELHRLENSVELHQALERQAVRQLGAYDRFLADLDHGEPQLVKRLAASQLNLMPEGHSALMLQPSANETVTDWIMQSEPAELPVAEPYPDTLLTRLATGPRRLWVLACGVFLVFIGLLLGPSGVPTMSSRVRRAGARDAVAAAAVSSGIAAPAAADASSDEHAAAREAAMATIATMPAEPSVESSVEDSVADSAEIAERLAAAGVTEESIACVASPMAEVVDEAPAPVEPNVVAMEVVAAAVVEAEVVAAPAIEPESLDSVLQATEVDSCHEVAAWKDVETETAEIVCDTAEASVSELVVVVEPEPESTADATVEATVHAGVEFDGEIDGEIDAAADDVEGEDVEGEDAEGDESTASGFAAVIAESSESDDDVAEDAFACESDDSDASCADGEDDGGIDIARAGTPAIDDEPVLGELIEMPSPFDRALDSISLFHGLPEDRWLDTRDPRAGRGS
jgi:hypothetical protein